jgi:hypothetical protein
MNAPTEPRSQTINRHVRAALHATGLPLRSYADRVVDLYHARTALHDRTVPFQVGATAAAYEAAARQNAQTITRIFGGTVRAPIDLEEALVLALPAPHRAACLRDLADRYGLLAAALPSACGVAQQMNTADLLRETGELMGALAPAFADGKLDASDAATARRALPEVLDLQARLATLSTQLECVIRAARTPSSLRIAQ